MDTGTLPGNRDSTDFIESNNWEDNPYWHDLDTAGAYLFTAAGNTSEVWEVGGNPGSPSRIGRVRWSAAGLEGGSDHTLDAFRAVTAVPSNPDFYVLGGDEEIGTVIVDTSSKAFPVVRYQNWGGKSFDAHAATLGGQDYAFTVLEGGVVSGLFAYNLTAADQLLVTCTERLPGGSSACPGVFVGRIGTERASSVAGSGDYLISAGGILASGFRIHRVSNPGNPVEVMDALAGVAIRDVALWQEGASTFAAVVSAGLLRIYDVSCIQSGFCAPGAPVWSQSLSAKRVSFSRSGSIPFLYVAQGKEDECQGGLQNEWLFNVSNPTAPVDISPQGTQVINGESVSYWGWYYRLNGVHGFNRVAPASGIFRGAYFYRAARGILDVHRRIGGSPPVADFDASARETYPGTPVSFTDLSTGAPSSWDWDFLPDGVPGNSSAQNPSGVTFPDAVPSAKSITLEACNAAGCDNTTQFITVLPPEPDVASVTVDPSPALACQPVTFQAQGVTGQPPLSFSWRVLDPGTTAVATGGGAATFVWNTGPSDTTGIQYTGEVTVTNASGVDVATSAPWTLQGLPALPSAGTFQATYPGAPAPTSSTTVSFSANVAGATEWNWDFGEGAGYQGWTSDPGTGPTPTHTFVAEGIYEVRVQVRNCLEAERESAALTLSVGTSVEVFGDGFESGNLSSWSAVIGDG